MLILRQLFDPQSCTYTYLLGDSTRSANWVDALAKSISTSPW